MASLKRVSETACLQGNLDTFDCGHLRIYLDHHVGNQTSSLDNLAGAIW